MAVRHVLVDRPPRDVWEVLGDAGRYHRWVVGTRASQEPDPSWPGVGAVMRYEAGLGPLRLRGHTTVRVCEPPDRLELEASAGRLGTARIAVSVQPWGEGTLVTVDEHPLRGTAARLHSAPLDVLLQLRHRLMLPRLRDVVEGRR